MVNYQNNTQNHSHILVIEDDKYRRTIALEESTYSIGRHKTNTIVVNSKQASRKHATLIRRLNTKTNSYSYWVLDGDLEGNKSVNGIFVNGEKCLVKELKNGDLINFGCNVNASYHSTTNGSNTSIKIERLRSGSTVHTQAKEQTIGDATSVKTSETQPSRSFLRSTITLTDDLPEKINSKETIQEEAFRDSLTELPNQTLFNEYLTIAISNAKRNESLVGLVLLDIEGFKKINDSFGYPVGDRLLKCCAERLNNCFRSGDIVARWGGDEFAILLPRVTSLDDVNKIAQRILEILKQPYEVSGQQLQLRSQMGIALYPKDGNDVEAIVQRATDNLRKNKEQGANNTCVATSVVDPKAAQLYKAKGLLSQALAQEEFTLYYQPRVNSNNGSIRGMEALLRWKHPRFGSVSPSKFIPLAEETDLIVPIGKWVLKTACLQNQEWQRLGLPALPIAVNLSPRQVQHPEVIKTIAQVLEETGLDPDLLELEVTESSITQNIELAGKVLQEIHQLGVRLTMDDFGIGNSSLGYLKQFPFNSLKIAQSFISDLKKDSPDVALLSALIALGRGLGLKVIAEGVETEEQVELLRQLQCEEIQGYRFSQPLKADEAARFIAFNPDM